MIHLIGTRSFGHHSNRPKIDKGLVKCNQSCMECWLRGVRPLEKKLEPPFVLNKGNRKRMAAARLDESVDALAARNHANRARMATARLYKVAESMPWHV